MNFREGCSAHPPADTRLEERVRMMKTVGYLLIQLSGFLEKRGSHAHRWVIVANGKRKRQV